MSDVWPKEQVEELLEEEGGGGDVVQQEDLLEEGRGREGEPFRQDDEGTV